MKTVTLNNPPAFFRVRTACLSLLLMLGLPASSFAHDARPVAVTISEVLPAVFQASLLVPDTVEADNQPVLVWPSHCRPAQGTTSRGTISMMCPGGLEGQAFTLDFPLFNPSLASFYRLDLLDGVDSTAILAPTRPVWIVPAAMTPLRVAWQYLQLGIEHIIGGVDHLLFVLGLLVIARTTRRILLTVTGFTVAHSITLSLSALGVVHIPIVPVEATIALSIVFLAYEISRHQQDSVTYRFPLLVSFTFGLLHGLGFASALGEIGLVDSEILLSLLSFNLGVETGQILFIAVVVALVLMIRESGRHLLRRDYFGEPAVLRRADLTAAYLIGIPASYWMIERILQVAA